jgi:hypothetical protein
LEISVHQNETMNYTEYLSLFDPIIDGTNKSSPYDNPHFIEYTKLNQSRMNRWHKKGELSENTRSTVQSISSSQTWIVITEPWCGDASHIVPFIKKMADLNPLINLQIQLRDAVNSEINNYLTNGGKSIPKLIVRNEDEKDLFNWGPRPKPCQDLFYELRDKGIDPQERKIEIQNWYNHDHGDAIQHEIVHLIKQN